MLGPLAPVPPDGFPVAILKRGAAGATIPMANPQISAEGAELRPFTSQPPLMTFWAAPTPGAREVRIRATDGGLKIEARFPVGPPAARVELALDPAAPVKGKDTSAELTIRLLRPDGTTDPEASPPVLRANVGSITDLRADGLGLYRARYLLPETRYPEVVILVAFSPWPHPQSVHGAFGRLLVPLATSIDLPGRTEPNATLSIEIAGAKYGPAQAGPDGRVTLKVVVPPGHRFGVGTAVDRVGNKKVTKIDLRLPPTDQLACVLNPPRVPADGVARARVLCATSDPFGKPVASAKVTLAASRGTLAGPRAVEAGLLEWIYTAPRIQVGGMDGLSAEWKTPGALSREDLKVELLQGPVARVSAAARESQVHYGGQVAVDVSVTDALDRPRPKAVVELSASMGSFAAPEETSPGKLTAVWTPPANGDTATAELSLRAWGPPGAEPARLSAWIQQGHLHASATDLAGLPVPRQELLAGDRKITTGEDGSIDLGPVAPGRLVLQHARWPGLRQVVYALDGGRGVFPAGVPPGAVAKLPPIKVDLYVPVNVRLLVSGRQVTYWVEDPKGRILTDRRVEVNLSGGSRGPSTASGGRTSFTVTATEPVSVSVADVQTGITVLGEVRP